MTYDAEGSKQAGLEAQAQVEASANAEWLQQARLAVRRTALYRYELTTDDVWQLNPLPPTRENRAMGPVMSWAAKAGFIESTGEFRPGQNIKHHANPKRVWRSLIYTGEPCSSIAKSRQT